MDTFYAVCAGILTVCGVVLTVYLVMTLTQLRETARAVQIAAMNINQRIESTRTLFETIDTVSNSVRGFWFKALQFVAGVGSGVVSRFMK